MFPLVLIAAVVGGFFWYRSRHTTTSAVSPSTTPPIAQSCEVTFTVASVQGAGPKIMVWAGKWGSQGTALARDSAIDLMKAMAPQCTWTTTTNATIHRADGTTTTWNAIMAALGNKTVAQAQQEVGNQIFGSGMG